MATDLGTPSTTSATITRLPDGRERIDVYDYDRHAVNALLEREPINTRFIAGHTPGR